MDESDEELIENIFERLGSGVKFNDEESSAIISLFEDTLSGIESRIAVLSEEISKEKKQQSVKYNEHGHYCQMNSTALHCFLNNVVQTIDYNVGKEDVVLEDLIKFSQQNGIMFPSISSSLQEDFQSVSSMNILIDEADENITQLWNGIRKKLKKGILTAFKLLPSTRETLGSKHEEAIIFDDFRSVEGLRYYCNYIHKCRKRYFGLLTCLFEFEKVFEYYSYLRDDEITEQYFSSTESIEAVLFSDNHVVLSEQLQEIVQGIKSIIHDDFCLFESLDKFNRECFQSISMVYLRGIAQTTQKLLLSFENAKKESRTSHGITLTEYDFRKFFLLLAATNNITNLLDVYYEQIFELFYLNETKKSDSSGELLVADDAINQDRLYDFSWLDECNTALSYFMKAFSPYLHTVFSTFLENIRSTVTLDSCVNVLEDEELQNIWECIPIIVSSGCSEFYITLNEILLPITWRPTFYLDDLQKIILSSFIDEFNILLNDLSEILAKDFTIPGLNITAVYMMLADVIFINYQMKVWELNISSKSLKGYSNFATISRRLSNVENEICKKIEDYHLYVLKTTLLYDFHSNHWQDEKAFMEGERVSFTISMLNYFMKGMINDMANIFPAIIWKKLIKNINEEVLMFLVSRYNMVSPSYRRMNQMKGDIYSILLIEKHILIRIAESDLEMSNVSENSEQLMFIHNMCTALAETLIVTSCPLNMLSDIVCKSQDIVNDDKINWLQVSNDIDSNSKIDKDCVIFEVVTNKQTANYNLLLKLLSRKKIIAGILQSLDRMKENHVVREKIHNGLSIMFYHDKSSKSICLKEERFLQGLFDTYLKISPRDLFVYFIGHFIIRDKSKSFKVSNTAELPTWLKLIFNHLYKFFKRILAPAIDLLTHENRHQKKPPSHFTKIQSLPCGCFAKEVHEDEFLKSVPALLHACVLKTLRLLSENIDIIPMTFWRLLSFIKTQEGYNASWVKQPNLGTKILASLLFVWLSEKENYAYVTYYTPMTEETYDRIKDFAELLWHVIFNLTHDVTDDPKISMDIFKHMQGSSEEIQKILAHLSSRCNVQNTENQSKESIDDPLFTLLPSTNEKVTMDLIFQVLKTNQHIIRSCLTNNDPAADNKETSYWQHVSTFDPLEENQKIGDCCISLSELIDKNLDWHKYLAKIPVTRVKNVIRNRFEFAENSVGMLTDEEKVLVSKILPSLQ